MYGKKEARGIDGMKGHAITVEANVRADKEQCVINLMCTRPSDYSFFTYILGMIFWFFKQRGESIWK